MTAPTDIDLEFTDQPRADDLARLETGLVEHAVRAGAPLDSEKLCVFGRQDGRIIGGLESWLYLRYATLFIKEFWLSEAFRGHGLGRRMVEMVEVEAGRRRAGLCYLDTFSFQALGFYQKLGYEVFGTLPMPSGGIIRYWLKKDLKSSAPGSQHRPNG